MPEGPTAGQPSGVVADWDTVFSAAADIGVAIEITGDAEGSSAGWPMPVAT